MFYYINLHNQDTDSLGNRVLGAALYRVQELADKYMDQNSIDSVQYMVYDPTARFVRFVTFTITRTVHYEIQAPVCEGET